MAGFAETVHCGSDMSMMKTISYGLLCGEYIENTAFAFEAEFSLVSFPKWITESLRALAKDAERYQLLELLLPPQIFDWCKDNVNHYYVIEMDSQRGGMYVYFSDITDATYFKLRWL
jgi:hypothetical protein